MLAAQVSNIYWRIIGPPVQTYVIVYEHLRQIYIFYLHMFVLLQYTCIWTSWFSFTYYKHICTYLNMYILTYFVPHNDLCIYVYFCTYLYPSISFYVLEHKHIPLIYTSSHVIIPTSWCNPWEQILHRNLRGFPLVSISFCRRWWNFTAVMVLLGRGTALLAFSYTTALWSQAAENGSFMDQNAIEIMEKKSVDVFLKIWIYWWV